MPGAVDSRPYSWHSDSPHRKGLKPRSAVVDESDVPALPKSQSPAGGLPGGVTEVALEETPSTNAHVLTFLQRCRTAASDARVGAPPDEGTRPGRPGVAVERRQRLLLDDPAPAGGLRRPEPASAGRCCCHPRCNPASRSDIACRDPQVAQRRARRWRESVRHADRIASTDPQHRC